jgi:sortase B
MNKTVRRLLFCAALAMIVVPAVWLGTTFWQYFQADREYSGLADSYAPGETVTMTDESAAADSTAETFTLRTIDWDALRAQNSEIVGWIDVDAIESLSYPVVRHDDDAYYLNHSYLGAANSSGAIFMETANSGDFADAYTIIYGHNMKSGKMFGSLKKFVDPNFYAQNGGGVTLYTPAGTYRYQIFSVEYVGDTDARVYSVGYGHDAAYQSFLEDMKARSLYDTGVDISADSEVLTLSTCSYNETTRFVVHAVRQYQVTADETK